MKMRQVQGSKLGGMLQGLADAHREGVLVTHLLKGAPVACTLLFSRNEQCILVEGKGFLSCTVPSALRRGKDRRQGEVPWALRETRLASTGWQAACLLGHAAPQYHGSHNLCGDGLEEVGAPRSTVAHIDPNKVCNDCRIPVGRKH